MTITYTVGTSSRNYSTIQAAWNAIVSPLTDNYVLDLYDDSDFGAGATCTGKTRNGFTITIKAAAGQSFKHNANRLTNRQFFIEANGVNVTGAISFDDDVILDGLQVVVGSGPAVEMTGGSSATRVRDCILLTFQSGSSGAALRLMNGARAVNCLLANMGGGVGGMSMSGNAEFHNCAAVAPSGTPGNTGFRGNFDSPVYLNCASFAFSTPFADAGGSSNYNATDGGSAPGANSVTGLTYANQYENINSAPDWRVKAGNGLGVGTRDQTNTSDFDIVGSARSTSTPTIGQWEYASADSTAPVLTSPTGTQTGSTTGTGGATTDEANGTFYSVASTSSTAPTGAQVEAGQMHTGSAAAANANVAVSTTGAKSVNFTGLSPSTTYYAHSMHKDAAGNRSNVVTSSSFTTTSGGTGTVSKVTQVLYGA